MAGSGGVAVDAAARVWAGLGEGRDAVELGDGVHRAGLIDDAVVVRVRSRAFDADFRRPRCGSKKRARCRTKARLYMDSHSSPVLLDVYIGLRTLGRLCGDEQCRDAAGNGSGRPKSLACIAAARPL